MRVDACYLALGCVLCGCAVDLASSTDDAPPSEAPAGELEACDIFPHLDGVRGRVTEVTLGNERPRLLAARPDFESSTASAVFDAKDACGASAEPVASRPILDVSAHGDLVGRPRGGFRADASYLYFSLDSPSGFASEGAGIARYDEVSETFVSLGLLWTGDRPSYGAGVAVEGDYVYVYGGLAARYLAADVYLARVPLDRLAEPAAYEYFQGGGEWATDPDLAGPLLEGGSMPSVWRVDDERYLMAYTTPLARSITVRSGLAPAGPWSRPAAFGACALPFEQAFCGEVSILPALGSEDELALAQTIDTFELPAGATERNLWTKLVRGALPSELP